MTNYQNNNTTPKSEKTLRSTSIGWILTNKNPEELGSIRGYRKR